MPKVAYKEHRFNSASQLLVDTCSALIAKYLGRGYSLTLRQLYYRLVAGGHIPNTQRQYKRLGNLINEARLAGYIDWHAIEDRTRELRGHQHWANPSEIMRAVLRGFQIDRWNDQPWRVEVWVEKDALVGVVGRACGPLDVNYFSCRGYTSQSEMWLASRRLLRHLNDDQNVLLIHLADHDPSGIDMTRDIIDRLATFWASHVEVKRIALNMDQIQQYQPPPNPAKVTDSRYNAYVADFGDDSWELDALEPEVIEDLIGKAILAYRDEDIWLETLEKETGMINLLDRAEALVREGDKWT